MIRYDDQRRIKCGPYFSRPHAALCIPCTRGVLWKLLLVTGYNSTLGVVDDEAAGLRALIDGTDAVDGHLGAGEQCDISIGVLSGGDHHSSRGLFILRVVF